MVHETVTVHLDPFTTIQLVKTAHSLFFEPGHLRLASLHLAQRITNHVRNICIEASGHLSNHKGIQGGRQGDRHA